MFPDPANPSWTPKPVSPRILLGHQPSPRNPGHTPATNPARVIPPHLAACTLPPSKLPWEALGLYVPQKLPQPPPTSPNKAEEKDNTVPAPHTQEGHKEHGALSKLPCGESPVELLVDTGCSTTILSSNRYRTMLAAQWPELTPYEGCLLSANNSPIDVLSRAVLNVHLEGWDVCQHQQGGTSRTGLPEGPSIPREFAQECITLAGDCLATHCRRGQEHACRVKLPVDIIIKIRS